MFDDKEVKSLWKALKVFKSIIIIYLTEKIHSKQNTLYALSVKNVISQEMEKRWSR